jgi:hypothetical protein
MLISNWEPRMPGKEEKQLQWIVTILNKTSPFVQWRLFISPLMLNMASFLYNGKFHTQRHFIKDENVILECEEQNTDQKIIQFRYTLFHNRLEQLQ